jgi:tetratricopeptide (TPR) repeat protein
LGLRGFTAWISGDLTIAGALADQALQLAIREGNPTILASRHLLQMIVRYWRGDLDGAEKYFTTGLEFFNDTTFRQDSIGSPIATFGTASWTAWTLGRADIARERMARMMAAANPDNPHDLVLAGHHAAFLKSFLREYEQAEVLALRAVELSEKHKFPNEAAISRCALGQAQAQLGRSGEGIILIRQGIAGVLESGQRLGVAFYTLSLAAAQAGAGALADALETIESALSADFDEPVFRPETLRTRGELRLEQAQTELAETDFRGAITLARSMGAKAWELRATISLARLLAKQGRRAEAHTMLAVIYDWFIEGFDTADLKDAKGLLDELNGQLYLGFEEFVAQSADRIIPTRSASAVVASYKPQGS